MRTATDDRRLWCERNAPGIPPEKVLFYKYRRHPSPNGLALYSPEVRRWCGFWPDGTPLTGWDEDVQCERMWYWDSEEEVMAVIREAYPLQSKTEVTT